MQLLRRLPPAAPMAARSKASGVISHSRPQSATARLTRQYAVTPAPALSKCLVSRAGATPPAVAGPGPHQQLSAYPPKHLFPTRPRYHSSPSAASQNTHLPPTEPTIHSVFDSKTGSWQYIVADPSTGTAVIIDAVLDYDPATQEISTSSADALLSLIRKEGYSVPLILETHVHADHLTAASYIQARLAQEQGRHHRPAIGIGEHIGQVQRVFGKKYGISPGEYRNVFDRLFTDNETFALGSLTATALHLPGHTPDHMGYQIGNNIFTGDTLFHVDLGTARCDFPFGSAESLYRSGQRLLSFPSHVRIWAGHDYPPDGPEGRPPVPCTSVGEHKERNKHLKAGVSEQEFVALRKRRDGGLAPPRLLHAALQINIRGGRMPNLTGEGLRLIHLPLRLDRVKWHGEEKTE
ncbi:beta-lactamase-like protein [Aspergillus terricola var. indicus]